MNYSCHVCHSENTRLLFKSAGARSLTSSCHMMPFETEVWLCNVCQHVMSKELEGAEQYYADNYNINLYHEDEDQLYEMVSGQPVYRTDHQLNVMTQKLAFFDGQKILDYGCGKSGMAKKLLEARPNLDFHFYDVSDVYRPYWEKMTGIHNCAVNKTPETWLSRFDLITSFFSLEHISDLQTTLNHIVSLLQDSGVFYAIVPDMRSNIADFVVVDHVNHFTPHSLRVLLNNVGLDVIEIDDKNHRGAITLVAKKRPIQILQEPESTDIDKVLQIANFWQNIGQRVQCAEVSQQSPFAIYGSGFYGAFIYAQLHKPEQVKCFLDNNSFLQGRQLFNTTIVAPSALPSDVKTLFVGLNPVIAREVISQMPWLAEQCQLVFLDEND